MSFPRMRVMPLIPDLLVMSLRSTPTILPRALASPMTSSEAFSGIWMVVVL